MSPELRILIAAIMGTTGATVAFWVGWRARDLQGPPRGSYGLPRGYRPRPIPSRPNTNPPPREP